MKKAQYTNVFRSFVILVILLASPAVLAVQQTSKLKPIKVLAFHNPPAVIISQDEYGNILFDGLEVNALRTYAASTGALIEFEQSKDFSQILNRNQSAYDFGIGGVSRTTEREKSGLIFSRHLITSDFCIITKSSTSQLTVGIGDTFYDIVKNIAPMILKIFGLILWLIALLMTASEFELKRYPEKETPAKLFLIGRDLICTFFHSLWQIGQGVTTLGSLDPLRRKAIGRFLIVFAFWVGTMLFSFQSALFNYSVQFKMQQSELVSMKELAGKSVAVIRGSRYSSVASKLKAIPVEYDSHDLILSKVKSGEVFAGLHDGVVLDYLVSKDDPNNFTLHHQEDRQDYLCIVVYNPKLKPGLDVKITEFTDPEIEQNLYKVTLDHLMTKTPLNLGKKKKTEDTESVFGWFFWNT